MNQLGGKAGKGCPGKQGLWHGGARRGQHALGSAEHRAGTCQRKLIRLHGWRAYGTVGHRMPASDGGGVGLHVNSQAALPQLLAKVLGMLLGHRHNNGHAQGARLRQGRGGA